MTGLITFLRARLDDDEREPGPSHCPGCSSGPQFAGTMYECDVDAHRARVLREVEAKRRILDLHSVDHECSTIRRGIDCVGEPYEEINNCTWVVDEDCSTLRLLALGYADHPDYLEEWKP